MKLFWIVGIALLVFVLFAGLFLLYKKYASKEPLTLVAGWNLIGKKWSTWLTLLAGAVLSDVDTLAAFLNSAADSLVGLWQTIPPDFHAFSPDVIRGIGWGVIALKMFASLWKQHRLAAQAAPQKDVLPAAKP